MARLEDVSSESAIQLLCVDSMLSKDHHAASKQPICAAHSKSRPSQSVVEDFSLSRQMTIQ
jgi:hypothetical protein